MATIPKPVARPSLTAALQYPIGVVHSGRTCVSVMWDVNPQLRYTADLWQGEDPDELVAAVMAGVMLLADEAAKLGTRMAVNITHSGVATATAATLEACPSRLIELIAADHQVVRMRSALMDMRNAARRGPHAVGDNSTAAPSAPPRPLTVCGTDASKSSRSGGPVAFGFVTSEGHYQTRHVNHGNVCTGELRGIQLAVMAHPGRDLLILTDSQHAVGVLMGQRHPSNPTELMIREEVWRATQRNGRTITIQWVPGHAGIPLNEAANRVAINEFGMAKLGTPMDVSRKVAEAIIAEMLPTLNRPIPEPVQPWLVEIRGGRPDSNEESAAA